MKAVLDANVLVSAAFPGASKASELIRRWRNGDYELFVSERLMAELAHAFEYPRLRARVTPRQAAALITALRTSAELRPDAEPVGVRSRDRDDDYLLGLAQSVGAILVTGDKDLLALADLPIETPAAFLDRLRSIEAR